VDAIRACTPAVALLILIVTQLASALPTLRASRANPLDALRMTR
jgi:ABC-type lipoprotein release transport system permease subunit